MPFKDLVMEVKSRPKKPRAKGITKIIDASMPTLSEAVANAVAPPKSWGECKHLKLDGDNALCKEFVSKCGKEKCMRMKK